MTDFYFDDSAQQSMFVHPELLCHPHIPKGLAGINPRTILGREWWDEQRRQAYEKNNYCCWACSIHGSDDPYEQRLEAHEAYEFDYAAKTATFVGTVALCHSCHCFIHSGRLWARYRCLAIPREKVEYVVTSRLRLLRDNGLQPFFYSLMIEKMLRGLTETQAYNAVKAEGVFIPSRGSKKARWSLKIGEETHYGWR